MPIFSYCERGFSAQKSIKATQRATLSHKGLNALLMVNLLGLPVQDIQFEDVVLQWHGERHIGTNLD